MLLAQTYNNLKQRRQNRKQRLQAQNKRTSWGGSTGNLRRSFSEDSGLDDIYAGYTGSADNLSEGVGPCNQSDDDDDLEEFGPAHLMLGEMLGDMDQDDSDPDHRDDDQQRRRLSSDSEEENDENDRHDDKLKDEEQAQNSSFDEVFENEVDQNEDAVSVASSRRSFTSAGTASVGTYSRQSSVMSGGTEYTEYEVDCAGLEDPETSALRQRQKELRAHPFFLLEVTLKEGKDLVIRDRCGTSDPYVKFSIGGKQLYKSRTIQKNLNPLWNEKFQLPIEDPYKPVSVNVFDYDRGMNDDPMGSSTIDPSTYELNVPTDVKLLLEDDSGKKKKKELYMGFLTLSVSLVPKTQEEKEQPSQNSTSTAYFKKVAKGESNKKLKTQLWSSVVNIVLVEGINLIAMDDNGYSDPYVKFRLGNEKYKSKYKQKTLNPKWIEQFDLYMFDDQTSHLEVSAWDHDIGGKDDIMGRAVLDLSTVEREKTHTILQELDDGAGVIKFLLTITATTGSETVADLDTFSFSPQDRDKVVCKYGLANSFKNIKDVGWVQVKVIKAQGLASADLGGKSDPFCVIELVNDRIQTHTEYKTLCPEWGKVFALPVKDIHSILEVTVYDEDKDKKFEFLGKIAIPLLRIHNGDQKWFALKDKKLARRSKGSIQLEMDFIYNHIRNGERRWFTLKDKKVMTRAKGAIQLELDFVFNHVKAAIRTFNPREEKFIKPDQKFKISVMQRNIDRLKKIAQDGVEAGLFLQSCFNWESYPRSIAAFAVFLIIAWTFELYMIPVTLLCVFLKELLVVQIVGSLMKDKEDDEYVDEEDDEDDDEKDKEEKKSFKEKLQAIQDVCLQVQEGMDMAASMGERVKNTFNWTVPWLSWLAVTLMCIGTVVLYYVPLRFLIIAFGINKFTKKLRAPNAIPNNELLDYLSRVPSDKELIMYRELRPDASIGTMKRKHKP